MLSPAVHCREMKIFDVLFAGVTVSCLGGYCYCASIYLEYAPNRGLDWDSCVRADLLRVTNVLSQWPPHAHGC